MNDWEHMQIAVHHREDGNIDYVARRENLAPSIATHQEMRGHFNVEPDVWRSYLQKLEDERWELENVETKDGGQNETYYFRRLKE